MVGIHPGGGFTTHGGKLKPRVIGRVTGLPPGSFFFTKLTKNPMTIRINNLSFRGTHGATEKERLAPQPFRVHIALTTWRTEVIREDLEETVDYREPKRIVREVIEGPHCELIETLADTIATRILEDKRLRSVEVTIEKPMIWENGVPSVAVVRHAPITRTLLDFDIDLAIRELVEYGGTTIPLLPEGRRVSLVRAADLCTYEAQPTVVGKHKVREELSSCNEFPEGSPFTALYEEMTDFLNVKLSQAKLKPFGTEPIPFNEFNLQKYEKGSIGITPHMDNKSSRNLILVLTLKGKGDFFLCADREGTGRRKLPVAPGTLTILRAPGFMGSSRRPFHCITNITEERIVFGVRNKEK